eukprot:gene14986-20159_t
MRTSFQLIFATIAVLSFAMVFHFSNMGNDTSSIALLYDTLTKINNQPQQGLNHQVINDITSLISTLESRIIAYNSSQTTNPDPTFPTQPSPATVITSNNNNNQIIKSSLQDYNQFTMKTKSWYDMLQQKMICLRLHRKGALFLYHVRKAGGTSIKELLHTMSLLWHVPLFESEGLVLDKQFLNKTGILTVSSLRDPVTRVLSLYWYEHVGWFDGILKKPEKCKTLEVWVNNWRDGSEWKNKFVRSNPGTVYVEIQNYYVKMLIGWKNNQKEIAEDDYKKAITILESFDLLFLTEWMSDETQIDAIRSLFPGLKNVMLSHKIKGDYHAKKRLESVLASNQEEVIKTIQQINYYDLRLYEHAQSLLAYRLKYMEPMMNDIKDYALHRNNIEERNMIMKCSHLDTAVSHHMSKSLGIFRPIGHKGPF